MQLYKQTTILLRPFLRQSTGVRLKAGTLLLLNLMMQGLVYYVTTPKEADEAQSDAEKIFNAYSPIIVPMLVSVAQSIVFYSLFTSVADIAQEDMVKRILMQNDGKNIGLLYALADPDQVKDIEQIGNHIYQAASICILAGEAAEIILMGIYWRGAYLSLPQARNILYGATITTSVACVLYKRYVDQYSKANEIAFEHGVSWSKRMELDLRNGIPIAFGNYHLMESQILQKHSQDRRYASKTVFVTQSKLSVIQICLGIALQNIVRVTVVQIYPELRGDPGLDTFSFCINLFAGTLSMLLGNFSITFSSAQIGLSKLEKIDQLLNELDDLHRKPFLVIEYSQKLQPNVAIRFENFSLCIPKAHQQKESTKTSSVIDKISNVHADKETSFIFNEDTFEYNNGVSYRISGSSGIGKSTLFKALHGVWPYAYGKIRFSCARSQIYTMPQNQMFTIDTLLANVFFPQPVPSPLDNSEMVRLHRIMEHLGLDQQFQRLTESTNWETDLSDGLKKRFNFLRMYFQASAKSQQNNPPLILMLDEMTSSVDGTNAMVLESLVCLLQKDIPQLTTLFIKHDDRVDEKTFNEKQCLFLSQYQQPMNKYQSVQLSKQIIDTTDSNQDLEANAPLLKRRSPKQFLM